VASRAYRHCSEPVAGGLVPCDPSNIETERMQVVTRSILHVPGAEFMDEKNVPHGVISVVT